MRIDGQASAEPDVAVLDEGAAFARLCRNRVPRAGAHDMRAASVVNLGDVNIRRRQSPRRKQPRGGLAEPEAQDVGALVIVLGLSG